MERTASANRGEPWNKGKLVGQKAPLRVKDVWAIRVRLQMQGRIRDLALFDLGIDSKLRACDLVRIRVRGRRMDQVGQTAARRLFVSQSAAYLTPSRHAAICPDCRWVG